MDYTKPHYVIVNTADMRVVANKLGMIFTDAEQAKSEAAKINAVMKPAFQNYTVATLTFDSEI